MYYFLSGYTAKVAGTERRRDRAAGRPSAPASAPPFLPLPPGGVRRAAAASASSSTAASAWLVNTGWTGGPYGTGSRMPARAHPRDRPRRARPASSTGPRRRTDPIFGFEVPTEVPGVDAGAARPAQHLGRRRGLRRRGEGPRDAHPGARGRDGRLGGHPPAGTPHENITVLSASSPGAIASLAVGMRWVRTLSWPAALLVGALVLAPAAHAGAPAPLLTITGSDADVWNVALPTPIYRISRGRGADLVDALGGQQKGSGQSPLRVSSRASRRAATR